MVTRPLLILDSDEEDLLIQDPVRRFDTRPAPFVKEHG